MSPTTSDWCGHKCYSIEEVKIGQIMFDSMLYKDEENYPKNEMKIASKSSKANYDDLK